MKEASKTYNSVKQIGSLFMQGKEIGKMWHQGDLIYKKGMDGLRLIKTFTNTVILHKMNDKLVVTTNAYSTFSGGAIDFYHFYKGVKTAEYNFETDISNGGCYQSMENDNLICYGANSATTSGYYSTDGKTLKRAMIPYVFSGNYNPSNYIQRYVADGFVIFGGYSPPYFPTYYSLFDGNTLGDYVNRSTESTNRLYAFARTAGNRLYASAYVSNTGTYEIESISSPTQVKVITPRVASYSVNKAVGDLLIRRVSNNVVDAYDVDAGTVQIQDVTTLGYLDGYYYRVMGRGSSREPGVYKTQDYIGNWEKIGNVSAESLIYITNGAGVINDCIIIPNDGLYCLDYSRLNLYYLPF